MKKLLTLLLTTTISFSCLAFTTAEKLQNIKECYILDGKFDELKQYHENKNIDKIRDVLKALSTGEGSCHYQSMNGILQGFVEGVVLNDTIYLCENAGKSETIDLIWEVFGISSKALEENKDRCSELPDWINKGLKTTIKEEIEKTDIRNIEEDIISLAEKSGYYYATDDKKVLEIMKSIIHSAKEKNWCYPVDKPNIAEGGRCPSESEIKYDREFLERLEKEGDHPERFMEDISVRREYALKNIENFESERCILIRKYAPCPDQETLYFASEFLKRYDTNWYNQNVKNWLAEKEKIFLEWDRKEAEESAKRAAENERKRAERKKADEELKKMGVDLDGDTNKIGIIMYNPKTGKTQKIN